MRNKETIVQEYLSGIPVEEIAKKHWATRETIYKTLRKLPDFREVSKNLVALRKDKRMGIYQSRFDEVCKLLEQGMYAINISKRLCIPYYVIKDMLANTSYDNSHESKIKRNKEIYNRYLKGETQTKLAKEYFITQAQISDIVHKFTDEQFRKRPKIRS